MQTIGHHTCLKDGGKEVVLKDAPFLAEYAEEKKKLPFLGAGYYYWDDNLSAAKWWGDNPKSSYKKSYFIVESKLNLPAGMFFDLVGNRSHMQYFVALMDKHRTAGRNKKWPIGAFMEFLKKLNKIDPNAFPFKVIRAIDHNAHSDELFFVPFVKGKDYYINLSPKLVICLLEKNSLILLSNEIVYES